MRRLLIQHVLPFVLSLVPLLAAVVVAVALPADARVFYLDHLTGLDWIILGLGLLLFLTQLRLSWKALRRRGGGFDERADEWLSNLAQAAEWFPLLGLLGTVAGILQTFSSFTSGTGPVSSELIIGRYAPALTATGSGLLMVLINILPGWVVLLGRGLILSLAGGTVESDPHRR